MKDTTREVLLGTTVAVSILLVIALLLTISDNHKRIHKQDEAVKAILQADKAYSIVTVPLVSPTFTRFGMVQEQCKKHPTTRIHIDGLIVDCASFNSWYNVIELRRRDSQESTTACTGCNTCAACARVETF